jgi:hypothetical protein
MRKRLWRERIPLREAWLIVALGMGLTGEAVAARTKSTKTSKSAARVPKSRVRKTPSPSLFDQILAKAEIKASADGKAVLQTGRQMIEDNVVGKKGCWDYINQIYSRAGYPHKKRQVLYDGRKKGPYADLQDVQPGDWLYYVNHSYKNIEHSAIFIEWVSRERNEALMLSYAGENKAEVARYKTYDLSSVYRIIRPSEAPRAPAGGTRTSKRVARR